MVHADLIRVMLAGSVHLHIVGLAGHARCASSMLGTETDLQVLEKLGCLFIDISGQCDSRTSFD